MPIRDSKLSQISNLDCNSQNIDNQGVNVGGVDNPEISTWNNNNELVLENNSEKSLYFNQQFSNDDQDQNKIFTEVFNKKDTGGISDSEEEEELIRKRYFHKHRIKKNIFFSFHPLRYYLFSKAIRNLPLGEKIRKEKEKRCRKKNADNIRRKIKRALFNKYCIRNLDKIIKSIIKYGLFLKKFPACFLTNVNRQENKNLLNSTLKDIFYKKELYGKKGSNIYNHNLNVLNNEIIRENVEFRRILNLKYSELFEEFVNSEEIIEEIEKLKKNGFTEQYINNYIYLARNMVKYFEK